MRAGITKRLAVLLSLLTFMILLSSTSSAAFFIYSAFPAGGFTSSSLPGTYSFSSIDFTYGQFPAPTDPQHQCFGDVPGNTGSASYTVWFGFSVAEGTVSIDTIGSNYDTIMTLYRYTPNVANLTPIACSDTYIASTQARIDTSVSTGRYVVQISRVGSSAAAGLSLAINTSYISATLPPSNDVFAYANLATLLMANGKALATTDAYAATIDPIDQAFWSLNSCPMYNTVWYQFTPKYTGRYTFDTSGSRLYRDNNIGYTDTVLTVYNLSLGAFALNCADGANYAISENINLTAGQTYTIGVGTFNDLNLLPPSTYRLKVTTYEIYDMLTNSGFEIGDTSGWKTKNISYPDGIYYLDALSGDYDLHIAAATGTKKQISQATAFPALNGFTPQKGGYFRLSYTYRTTGEVKGDVSLTVQYSNRPPVKVKRNIISDSSGIVTEQIEIPVSAKTVTSIKVNVKVKSGSGLLEFDDAYTQYFGSVLRNRDAVLGLPPAPGQ